MRMFLTVVLCASLGALAACLTPPPKPDPPPGPAPASAFTCDGRDSVQNFDGVANAVVLAAQVSDDEAAMTGLDKVAIKNGGVAVVQCVIDLILPDFRAAPVTGVHLEAWGARAAPAVSAGAGGGGGAS